MANERQQKNGSGTPTGGAPAHAAQAPAAATKAPGRLTLGRLSLVILILAGVVPLLLVAAALLINGETRAMTRIAVPLGAILLVTALGMGIATRRELSGRITLIASVIVLVVVAFMWFVPSGPSSMDLEPASPTVPEGGHTTESTRNGSSQSD